MTIVSLNDREIRIERQFQAPQTLVYRAYTEPDLVRRWLGLQNGWTFLVCDMDVRVGGAYRWVWRETTSGYEMGMGGNYLEVTPPARIVATERFDQAWYPGGAIVSSAFVEDNHSTTLIMTLLYESTEARDSVLRSPMQSGLSAGFVNLDTLLGVLLAS